MKRLLALLLCIFGLLAHAQDDLTVASAGGQFSVIDWSWTSDGSGNATGVTTEVVPGVIASLATVPSGSDAPTDNYDIVVKQVFPDVAGVDVVLSDDLLDSGGLNRDTANTELATFWPTDIVQCHGKVRIEVTNAGSATQGRIKLFVYRTLSILRPPNGTNGIPLAGATARILQYSSPATAKWIALSGGATIADGGAVTITSVPHAAIVQGGATSGQVLKWNGSAWAPADDSTVGGGAVALTDIDTEAELEAILTDVTNLYTNNDGAMLLSTSIDTESELETILTDVTNVVTNNDLPLADANVADDLTIDSTKNITTSLDVAVNGGDITSTGAAITIDPAGAGKLTVETADAKFESSYGELYIYNTTAYTSTPTVFLSFDAKDDAANEVAWGRIIVTPLDYSASSKDSQFEFWAFNDNTQTKVFQVTDAGVATTNAGTIIQSGHSLTGDVTGTLDTDGGTALTVAADSVALTTDTTGNYVASVANGSGISGGSAGSEGATLTLALGALTADWSQTGAYDVTLNNASSELKILESSGATYYGILDAGDLGADRTYTFPNKSGTVKVATPIWLGAAGAKPTTTNGATAPKLDANDHWVCEFPASKYAFWEIPIPSDYDGSVDAIRVYWYKADTNDVTWALANSIFAHTTATNQGYTAGSDSGAQTPVADQVMIDTISDSDILGSISDAGKLIKIRLGSNAFTGTSAFLLGVELEY